MGRNDRLSDDVHPRNCIACAIARCCPDCSCRSTWASPVATVEAFRNLWFHTGDAAYCDDAGALYFVDRPGDRIRARGEDVTSFQMEDLVNSSPDVELSAAFPIRATEGDEDDVVVFVVPRAGVVLTAKDLHAWADREMPKYMRPEHVRHRRRHPSHADEQDRKVQAAGTDSASSCPTGDCCEDSPLRPRRSRGCDAPSGGTTRPPAAATPGWCARRRSSTSSTSTACVRCK